MKKIWNSILLIIVSFLFIGVVKAETIQSINMDIYVDSNGDAHVTETWETTATEKTEYYHAFYNIGNSEITDLTVKDETTEYSLVNWNVDASLEDKAYKYGYNYTNNGVELCFGKSSYGNHTYTLTYTIQSFVSRVDDADIIYWNLLDSISPSPSSVNIVIYADQPFSDDLDVWGYGNYGGLAYVYDGKIYLSSDGKLGNDEYMVALVKFPLNSFNTTNNLNQNFEYYHDMAETGANHYKETKSIGDILIIIINLLFYGVIFLITIFSIVKGASKGGIISGSITLDYGEQGNKLPKEVNMFRDLPCNKDIYRAYWVAYNYGLMKRKTDFLGTILLKWLKEGKVRVENKTVGTIFKKEATTIVFSQENCQFDNSLESDLYDYMFEASKDGILESKEFEKWCQNHYSRILNWFDNVLNYENKRLEEEGKLVKQEKTTLKIFKFITYQVNPSMKEEAIQMKGLKLFFNEFENMKDKSAIEVMLWEEYLMYAQIFGVADKVAKQFKQLYPDVVTDYSYDSVIWINDFSYSGISSATTARSRAESYSSGGGGFSSGGGGGGSFGGGGGGSR